MATNTKILASASFFSFVANRINSRTLKKLVLWIFVCYLSYRFLKKLFKSHYDKVKYTTLKQIISSKKVYDFIVIGSGTSGSVVAGLLARDPRKPKVLLIEAGCPDNYHPFSQDVIPVLVRENQQTHKDWKYYTTPQKQGCHGLKGKKSCWPRGKVIGGSSILNYMMYVKGNKHDYNEWSDKYQCSNWSYSDLQPIFQSLEKCLFPSDPKNQRGYHGLQKISKKPAHKQGHIAQMFVAAAMNAGYAFNDDYNGECQDGVWYSQFNIDENGRRQTSFRAFVASLFEENESYNIDILPNTQVTRIVTKQCYNANSNIAIGVECGITCKLTILVDYENGGEVIVSAGAVDSPKLLLLSGIGDEKQLKQHNIDVVANIPGIGRNLRDHFMQGFYVEVPEEKTPSTNAAKLFYDYAMNGEGLMTTSCLDVGLFCKSEIAKKNERKGNDIQMVLICIPENELNVEEGMKAVEKYCNADLDVVNPRMFKLKHARKSNFAFMCLPMNVRPKSVGYVRLKSSDPYEAPEINPNYLSNEEDMQVWLDALQKGIEICEQEPFKSCGCKVVEYERFKNIKEFGEFAIQNELLTIYHPVGTCRMGNTKTDEMAVCDPKLKVRTFSNLRVIDASSAPDLVAANTQAMCYVIGAKGAQMILQDWK